MSDLIDRQAAIDAVRNIRAITGTEDDGILLIDKAEVQTELMMLPSAQPFHNITMSDVLKYIDGMPEDVWQEFTACLECRGWDLQRRVAKWCGGEFA